MTIFYKKLIINPIIVIYLMITAYIIHYTVTLSAFIETQNIIFRLLPVEAGIPEKA